MAEDEMENEVAASHKVVVNHEEQYSIWPAGRENPPGWRDVGKSGSETECLDLIGELWTDMRPLSSRKKMAADASEDGREERSKDSRRVL